MSNYLNAKNPDVLMHYNGYKLRNGIKAWEELTDRQLTDFEMDFMARLPMFQQEREYLYPFFLNINNAEVRVSYEAYAKEHKIGLHAWRDSERDDFERQLAAEKVREYERLNGEPAEENSHAVSACLQ